MRKLNCKVQYSIYERGEFSDIGPRTFEESIELINNFPWEKERYELFIGLDGPSVTIESNDGCYLKIGVYYNAKFILYYLDNNNNIYCQVGEHISDLESTIRNFYDDEISISSLNKYRDFLTTKKKYFVTKRFQFSTSVKQVIKIMFLPIIFTTLFLVISLVGENKPGFLLFVVLAGVFLIPQCILFLNYLFFSKNLRLNISRGNNTFSFGTKKQILIYSKDNIKAIISFNNQTSKNPWGDFYSYHIELKSGEILKFTNLMIGFEKMRYKFPHHIIRDKHKFFPLIKKKPKKF